MSHVQSNRAPGTRRRTYRAHGRINAYMGSPAHVEIMVTQRDEGVAKAEEASDYKPTRKQLAKRRLATGGGVEA